MESRCEYRYGMFKYTLTYFYIFLLHVEYVYIHIKWFSFPDVCFVFCKRDTAGQERYQTITKQYYRRAQVIPPRKQSHKSSYLS